MHTRAAASLIPPVINSTPSHEHHQHHEDAHSTPTLSTASAFRFMLSFQSPPFLFNFRRTRHASLSLLRCPTLSRHREGLAGFNCKRMGGSALLSQNLDRLIQRPSQGFVEVCLR